MFLCNSCHGSFDMPHIIKETHGAPMPYYEAFEVCPDCGSRDFKGLYSGYCRCCGRKIPACREYCNESCRRSGEQMWARERELRAARETDPLHIALREVAEYNKAHKTNLSYGQYMALKGSSDGSR